MSPITVFGHGATGRLIVARLAARGIAVRVAQRTDPGLLPAGATFVRCDILDREAVRRAADGVAACVIAVGFPYDSRVWRIAWPRAMRNVLAACAAADARLVFIDSLYQLGPQRGACDEDTLPVASGIKQGIRAEVTELWMSARGRVPVAALRCPDFYGPAVSNSHLGALGLARLARGRAAVLMVPPDIPHDFAYVPDIARAAVTLLDAPEDAYGQAWNMPCAPTLTPRAILALGAAASGRRPAVRAIPFRLLPALGLVSRMAREVADIGFTWDRPYRVDAGKFGRRFWSDATPFTVGTEATVRSFAPEPASARDAGRAERFA